MTSETNWENRTVFLKYNVCELTTIVVYYRAKQAKLSSSSPPSWRISKWECRIRSGWRNGFSLSIIIIIIMAFQMRPSALIFAKERNGHVLAICCVRSSLQLIWVQQGGLCACEEVGDKRGGWWDGQWPTRWARRRTCNAILSRLTLHTVCVRPLWGRGGVEPVNSVLP